MPYSKNTDLPPGVRKNLPGAAQSIYRKAFNSAYHGTCNGDDGCAARVGWSAVKKVYKKKDGKWVKKQTATDTAVLRQFFEYLPTDEINPEDIPTFDGIDVEQLTKGDDNPVFVALPIFQTGRIAEDGLRYTERFTAGLAAQMAEHRVTGHMGHLPDMPLFGEGYEKGVPPGIWVGIKQAEDSRYFGKAYILKSRSDVRDYMQSMQAAGGLVGTSIYGPVDLDAYMFHDDGTYEVDPAGFTLRHIDFVEADRAALQDMNRDLKILAHSISADQGEVDMEFEEYLESMEPDDIVAALPESVIAAVLEQNAPDEKPNAGDTEAQDAQLSQITGKLAQADRQLAQAKAKLFQMALDAAVREAVETDDESLRDFVQVKTLQQLGSETDENKIADVVTQIVESDTYTALATAVLSQKQGGGARIGAGSNDNGKTAGELAEEEFRENGPPLGISYGV
jgi:cation transport regulator